MITYVEGDIFNSPAQVIVNTVNTMGVMGKGIALEYKKRYPHMFEQYKKMCEKHLLQIGKLAIVYERDHWILLFPTKINWRYPSKLEYIDAGLEKFVKTYAEKHITSIAFPKLGCGNGELNWEDVKALMEKYLAKLPIDVYIYLKTIDIKPEHKQIEEMTDWLKNNAKDLSFDGMLDDIKLRCAMLPIEIMVDENKYLISYNDGLDLCTEGGVKAKHYTSDELYSIWDDIREQNIYEVSDDSKLFCELLTYLGYLGRVKIVKSEKRIAGYQLHNGLGRWYGTGDDK